MIRRSLWGLVLLVASSACGGDQGSPTEPAPTTVSVQFRYAASTTVDPDVDFVACSDCMCVFRTHLHATWVEWDSRHDMTANGPDEYVQTLDVPVGRAVNIAVHDPNNCSEPGGVYVAPPTVRANGVLLGNVVGVTEGEGLRFTVSADGTISQ